MNHDIEEAIYTLGKIARREDAVSERPSVYIGQTVTGNVFIPNRISQRWERQPDMYPIVGEPIRVQRMSISGEFIQTSKVTSWCKLGCENDKLVLPKDFPIKSLPETFDFKEGDILIATLNSIYLAKRRKDLES